MMPTRAPGTARLLLAASGWLALACTLFPAGSVERIVPTVAFLALGPGAACLGALRRLTGGSAPSDDRLEEWVIAVVVSLSLATLVSEALFLAHGFTLPRAMLVLAGLTSAAALAPGRSAGHDGSPRRAR
jgi:hypothetical protein